MSQYLPFYTDIWSDKNFKRIIQQDGNYLKIYMYLVFNPHITLTGIYDVDLDECQHKTRTGDAFESVFKSIVSGDYNIEFDSACDKVFIVNRFKYLPSHSPKVVAGAIAELNHLSHPFKQAFIKKYHAMLEPFMFKLDGFKPNPHDNFNAEEFVINASKLYNSRTSLTRFLANRNMPAETIESIISKVLPNIK